MGDDIFFLTSDEIIELLQGEAKYTGWIPARKKTYQRYSSLPPYPMVIRGQFDPFKWAADPNRRTNYYDSHGVMDQIYAEADQADPSSSQKIYGEPGSAGVIEGVVRRIDSVSEGSALQSGEILVTSFTNIGWSHLFPLVGAIVTDIGAALSHAAIVAREMGVPAVVNCGDATMRLKTGDRVRVDGGLGIVEILE